MRLSSNPLTMSEWAEPWHRIYLGTSEIPRTPWHYWSRDLILDSDWSRLITWPQYRSLTFTTRLTGAGEGREEGAHWQLWWQMTKKTLRTSPDLHCCIAPVVSSWVGGPGYFLVSGHFGNSGTNILVGAWIWISKYFIYVEDINIRGKWTSVQIQSFLNIIHTYWVVSGNEL